MGNRLPVSRRASLLAESQRHVTTILRAEGTRLTRQDYCTYSANSISRTFTQRAALGYGQNLGLQPTFHTLHPKPQILL